jgi:hypothetical protein
MNKEIQKIVEQLHEKESFKFELSKATTRKISTIDIHWLKKDGYQIPEKFQRAAASIAVKLKRKQDKELNGLNVKL